MLYLGEIDNHFYVFHSIWRYVENKESKIINKVVLSDLSLGEKNNSLLKKLSIISNLNLKSRE